MAGDIGITERVVVLSQETAAASAESMEAPGTRIIHRYGPRVRIGEVPPSPEGEREAAPASIPVEDLDAIGALGLAAFALRQSPEYAAAKAQRPYQDEPWDGEHVLPPDPPDHLQELVMSPALAGAAAAALGATSAQMTGSVAVGIIIVSGPTADLQFSAAETQKVIAEVQNGLGWLAAQNPAAGITWTYDIHSVNVNVQPNGGNKEALWRNPAMASLGYSASWQGVIDYVANIRAQYQTQWAYVAYFTKYPLNWFAYANLGGPRLVMQYANDGWGPDNIDRVYVHETGHIFQAPDEYKISGCNCGGSWGIYNKPNGNCENCAAGGGVDCLMRANKWALCTYTPWHYGWPLAPPVAFNVTGNPGIKIGSAPAMAEFNGRLYIAFQADDSSHTLFVTSSPDGNNWTTPAVGYPGIRIGSAPAMAEFNGRLYIAFQADDSAHTLFVTSSPDGNNWTTPAVGYSGIKIGSAPTMSVWNEKLFLAFQANDSSHRLHVTGTSDGTSWLTPASAYPTIKAGSAPALTTFNNQLYVALQADDSSHLLYTGGSA
jgi:hypothetical protein